MTLVVFVVEISTLLVIHNIQKKDNQKNAIVEVDSITQSLNNDLLKVMLNPSADMLSDISFKLSAFKKVKGLVLFDATKNEIYKYGNVSYLMNTKDKVFDTNTIFTDDDLLIKKDLSAEGYTFGYILLDIDLSEYKQKQLQTTYTILIILPLALLFGFIVSLFLSKSYTKPFIDLLNAMKNSEPTNNKITIVETSANNEIKELFDGFNTQMKQISKSSQQLHHQATHDQLTNIYNRFYIENELQELLKSETAMGYNLLYIDLDQFKLINDSVGFQAGDELLKMITTEYATALPNNATFARVDGDGFMVLLKDCTKDSGVKMLERSLEKLSDFRFVWQGETYSISASIALIYFEPFQYTLKELLKASNTGIYTAKSKGRNKSHIYDPSDDITKRFNTELEKAALIKEALKDGPARFELFAQDIVPLQEKSQKVSYEILIRMWDKDKNFISPGDFFTSSRKISTNG